MEIISDPTTFQERCRSWREKGQSLALVPTMGAFHQGHLSLMRHARPLADKVAVSLFVNPAQFGPREDLSAYPRDLDRDARLAREAGTDLLFTPAAGAMYAPDHATWVDVPDLARGLCGRSRPGHFRGVATVVAKLLLLALPRAAVFGEKDWQQLAVIRRMVRDLHIPVRIEGHAIVREADGLAMSSRNAYLTPEERAMAPALSQGLRQARAWVREGLSEARVLAERLALFYAGNLALGRVDYIEVVDPASLEPVEDLRGPALLAVAVHLGRARLIDNMLLNV